MRQRGQNPLVLAVQHDLQQLLHIQAVRVIVRVATVQQARVRHTHQVRQLLRPSVQNRLVNGAVYLFHIGKPLLVYRGAGSVAA